ncbi:MAG: yliI 1 [Marmoricola sp.]|nr:yliI 1 [Marmoricola sp.]
MTVLAASVTLAATVLAGCGGSSPDASSSRAATPAGPAATGSTSGPATPAPRVVGTVASRLEVPWGIAFLPDGSALVTERDSGRVLRVRTSPGSTAGEPGEVDVVGRVDEARPGGEAGLLGVAVSPTFAEDRRVFLYATGEDDNRVLRTTLDLTRGAGRLGALTPVLTGIPKAVNHDGGRLLFGPDGSLFVSTGEAGQPDLAQDPDSLGGKILRITQEGRPAAGNPRADSPIWTSGHRNVQGLAFDDRGRLWASEFGQNTRDELNLVERGRNYGWPEVEGRGGASARSAGFTDPQVQWDTSENSPSGLAFADDHLWLGALQGERLWRVEVEPGGAGRARGFLVGDHGRVRTVVRAPSGDLWVTTSNRDGRGDPAAQDDRILLVRP